ncbi:hypothetical protein RHGRI_030214 [Rhododendron griersonianum]|uniref:Uncharacterized protein n=1 Tax=Rhododendron griersonianum TaxID=479676 RepID=A0AAV6IQ97_9ERIC|nr:hypothetical protein RHGRI_030214 [Rhododendron griersonianum]
MFFHLTSEDDVLVNMSIYFQYSVFCMSTCINAMEASSYHVNYDSCSKKSRVVDENHFFSQYLLINEDMILIHECS